MSDEEITEAIVENATGPKEVTIDGFTTKAHSLQDQIAAHKHLQATQAQAAGGLGVKFYKLVPPGAS